MALMVLRMSMPVGAVRFSNVLYLFSALHWRDWENSRARRVPALQINPATNWEGKKTERQAGKGKKQNVNSYAVFLLVNPLEDTPPCS
jgi:hypothetical protein